MRFPLPPHITTGWLFVLAALLTAGAWFVLLFVAMPPDKSVLDSALGQMRYTFSAENDNRWWFVWFAVLPIACGLLAVAYFLNVSRTKHWGVTLLTLTVALALASFMLNDWF